MKLWEALEKSNMVRRKEWDNDFCVKIDPDKKIANDSRGGISRSITIKEFYADDWEPCEEPKPVTELAQLKKIVESETFPGTHGATNSVQEALALLVYIFEQQQKQIDELKLIAATGTKGNQSQDQ